MTDERDEPHGTVSPTWAEDFARWYGSRADHDDQARRDLAAERGDDYAS